MVDRSLDARVAPTTGHMSARNRDAEVAPCGKRRRRCMAEQKRQIVAESLEPGASVATVAARHGISSGQFYAWRQQLVLRGATGAGSDSTSRLVGGDVTTAAPRGAIAIPAPLRRSRHRRNAGRADAAGSAGRRHHSGGWRVGTGERKFPALRTLPRPIVGASSTARSPHERTAVRATKAVTPCCMAW